MMCCLTATRAVDTATVRLYTQQHLYKAARWVTLWSNEEGKRGSFPKKDKDMNNVSVLEQIYQLEREHDIAIKVFTRRDAEDLLKCDLSDSDWESIRNHPEFRSIARLNKDDESKIRKLVSSVVGDEVVATT